MSEPNLSNGNVIDFKSRSRSSVNPDSIGAAEGTLPINNQLIKTGEVIVNPFKRPEKEISLQKLYNLMDGESSLATALRLLEEGEAALFEAKKCHSEDDLFGADNAVQQFQVILPELFCCRQIGDSFGTLIHVFFHALKNLNGVALSQEQATILHFCVSNLKQAPYMPYSEAVAHVVRLENVGLNVAASGLIPIQEVLIG